MKRYDQAIDIYLSDSAACMYECSEGEYVKYSDYKDKIDLAIAGFRNLQHCRIGENSATDLNEYVANMIENLR